MNSEPCVRLGMRISPKIRAKPAESRNSRPPKAMLFAASSQRFMRGIAGSARQRRIHLRLRSRVFSGSLSPKEHDAPSEWRAPSTPRPSSNSALQRRVVARIDRLGEEPFLLEGPELADVL